MGEFGFSDEVRASVEAAERNAPFRYVPDPAARNRRTFLRTNRASGEVEAVSESYDPVPDAVRAAIANHMLGNAPIACPFVGDEAARFWAGVEQWQARFR